MKVCLKLATTEQVLSQVTSILILHWATREELETNMFENVPRGVFFHIKEEYFMNTAT